MNMGEERGEKDRETEEGERGAWGWVVCRGSSQTPPGTVRTLTVSCDCCFIDIRGVLREGAFTVFSGYFPISL